MFEIKNVSKKYNHDVVLENISFTLGTGLNFIVGASGSGKTTLLKIISGMEQHFDGEVTYAGKNIKTLSTNEKSYMYNHIFGFVWQDFNLLEDVSVLENVLLPQYLTDVSSPKNAEKILKELKIFELANQKVKTLSGGQKQRVAIARELMKNPKVIIADEPTSALDDNSSETIMDILTSLAKHRTVIIVTHDVNLIGRNARVIDLDERNFEAMPQQATKTEALAYDKPHRLSIKNAFSLTKSNIKSKFGRVAVSALSLLIAGMLLLTMMGGTIENSNQGDFDELFETYGETLTDISIVGSFMSASGASGDVDEPSADVTQNIDGLYDQYMNDERVDFTVFLQAFDNITIDIDGQNYPIQGTGSVPVLNKLVAGNMPTGNGYEIVVPESFVKTLGLSNEQAIGKELDFNSAMYNWDSGEPVLNDAAVTATIVGVADNTVSYEYEGQVTSFNVDDAFFFSKAALQDLRTQAGIENSETNFLVRAKTPEQMIAIKDELNEQGIVPLGMFELVEDIVRLNDQTSEQSSSANILITFLAIVMVCVIAVITAVMRKREFAIYKVSGFNTAHFAVLSLTEKLFEVVIAIVVMLVTSPLLDIATQSLFDTTILNANMLLSGAVLIALVGIVAYITTVIIFIMTKTTTALKTGDR